MNPLAGSTIFIVVSVIYFKDRRLSYSRVRSKFSPLQRAEQTLTTIRSIRQRVPGAKILLVEAGLGRDLPLNLAAQADEYIFLGDHFFVRRCVDSVFKGLGEAAALLAARRYIYSPAADFYFKISGRYYLNDNFNPAAWPPADFVCRRYGRGISTRLYGFSRQGLGRWLWSLVLSIPLLLVNRSIEQTMPFFLNHKNLRALDKLGLSGYGSAFGEVFNE